ncbi:MAG: DUF3810 domain-containing protein [Candidatus Aminicenantes bacterium]|nr:DUF3810 domain-containing protein [Candidatus Aminicenantes bacterium]
MRVLVDVRASIPGATTAALDDGVLPSGLESSLRGSTASQVVYDRYLKSQGVKEGLASYDRFVSLVVAWKRRTTAPSGD